MFHSILALYFLNVKYENELLRVSKKVRYGLPKIGFKKIHFFLNHSEALKEFLFAF